MATNWSPCARLVVRSAVGQPAYRRSPASDRGGDGELTGEAVGLVGTRLRYRCGTRRLLRRVDEWRGADRGGARGTGPGGLHLGVEYAKAYRVRCADRLFDVQHKLADVATVPAGALLARLVPVAVDRRLPRPMAFWYAGDGRASAVAALLPRRRRLHVEQRRAALLSPGAGVVTSPRDPRPEHRSSPTARGRGGGSPTTKRS